ncbi:MAG: UDPGP type 1 family protein, partial [Planctomycetota bacterium]
MPELEAARRRLEAVGQEHVLTFADQLDADARAGLLAQIDALDLETLPALIDKYVHSDDAFELPDQIDPAPYYPRDPAGAGRTWDAAATRAAGDELIAAGKVACFTVAGGQGTRLGYNGPKGCYPTSCVTEKPLFE